MISIFLNTTVSTRSSTETTNSKTTNCAGTVFLILNCRLHFCIFLFCIFNNWVFTESCQKHSFTDVLENRYSENFHKYHRKILVLASVFKLQALSPIVLSLSKKKKLKRILAFYCHIFLRYIKRFYKEQKVSEKFLF